MTTSKPRPKPQPKPIAIAGVVIEEDVHGRKFKVVNEKGVVDVNVRSHRIRHLARLLGFDDLYYDARDLATLVSEKLGLVPSKMIHDQHENKIHITYEIDLNKVGDQEA